MKMEHKGYLAKDGLWKICVKLCIEGEPYKEKVEFIIDTGSQISILSPKIAKNIGYDFDTLSAVGAKGIGNSKECWARRLDNVDIILTHDVESEEFVTLCEMYVPDPSQWQRDEFSLIGQDVLRQYDIISDNKNRIITLTFIGLLSPPRKQCKSS